MDSQTKTTTDQINYEYSLLKDIDLETVFKFYNSMNEFEPLSKEMFLEAWNRFNEDEEPEYIDTVLGVTIDLKTGKQGVYGTALNTDKYELDKD